MLTLAVMLNLGSLQFATNKLSWCLQFREEYLYLASCLCKRVALKLATTRQEEWTSGFDSIWIESWRVSGNWNAGAIRRAWRKEICSGFNSTWQTRRRWISDGCLLHQSKCRHLGHKTGARLQVGNKLAAKSICRKARRPSQVGKRANRYR